MADTSVQISGVAEGAIDDLIAQDYTVEQIRQLFAGATEATDRFLVYERGNAQAVRSTRQHAQSVAAGWTCIAAPDPDQQRAHAEAR